MRNVQIANEIDYNWRPGSFWAHVSTYCVLGPVCVLHIHVLSELPVSYTVGFAFASVVIVS